jgi:hypothetical protein
MASNKELAAEAVELAEELGTEVTTDGLNNKALSALVSDLKAKKKDAELQTQAEGDADDSEGDQSDDSEGDADDSEGDADDSEGDADEEDERAPGVYIADGKAVTSKIGVLSEGRAVEAKHFVGGQKTLDNLIKRGHCVKVG